MDFFTQVSNLILQSTPLFQGKISRGAGPEDQKSPDGPAAQDRRGGRRYPVSGPAGF